MFLDEIKWFRVEMDRIQLCACIQNLHIHLLMKYNVHEQRT